MGREMKRITRRPQYAKKYTSFILIKFIEERKYLESFLSGKLFMRSQSKFDDVDLGKGRADDLEGATVVVSGEKVGSYPDVRFAPNEKGKVHVEVHELKERPDNYKPPYFSLTPNESIQRKIFCTYTLWRDEKALCEIKKDMVTNFGKYGVVITDSEEFLHRVDSAVKLNPTVLDLSAGFVEYFKHDTIVDIDPFMKREELFGYQNEFRLCAETDNTEPSTLFDMHRNLYDIAIPVKTDIFLDSVTVGDDGFFFDKQAIIKLN